jgi:signal transduction histidine kinase
MGFKSSMIVPLNAGGRTIGDLALVSAESGRRFTEDDLAIAQELAARCALAVDNARLYAEAQDAIRLRDEFLAIASHELRTPLTGLLGNVELLERRAGRDQVEPARLQRTAGTIRDQAHRLQRLVNQLLELSRIQTGLFAIERRPLDLAVLLRSVAEELRPALRQHQLNLEDVAEPLIVEGDQHALEQVFHNLLGNSIKYSPRGGPIDVCIERRDGFASVAISDRGIGIPNEAVSNIFQRFYRAANVRGDQISGFGLGLYLVKEIVSRHDGEVTAFSTEGEGSTFTVRLPLSSV